MFADDAPRDFQGFRESREKAMIAQHLDYARGLTCEAVQELNEDDGADVMDIDNDAPIVHSEREAYHALRRSQDYKACEEKNYKVTSKNRKYRNLDPGISGLGTRFWHSEIWKYPNLGSGVSGLRKSETRFCLALVPRLLDLGGCTEWKQVFLDVEKLPMMMMMMMLTFPTKAEIVSTFETRLDTDCWPPVLPGSPDGGSAPGHGSSRAGLALGGRPGNERPLTPPTPPGDPMDFSSLLANLSAGGTAQTPASRWLPPSVSTPVPGAGSPSVLVKILLETIMVLMCLAAITGNVLVIAIIAVTKHFHSVTSVFLVNLAVSDCLVGLGVMPFVAMSVFYQDWNRYNDLCLYVGYTSSVYCTASVLTLAAIALDRYHAIIDCLQYNSQSTVRRTVATVVWIWLQSAISSCPPLLGWGRFGYSPAIYSCSVEWTDSLSYTGFVTVFSFLLPASVMIFCYVRIVRVARGHAKRIHDIENQLQRNVAGAAGAPDRPTFSELISSVNSRIISELQCEEARASCGLGPSHLLPASAAHGRRSDIFSKYSSPGREHHGAFRLFLVIFAFFCCWVPYEIVGLVQAVEAALGGRRPSSIPPGVVTAAHWLALLNSDINPLLYALLSKRFRKALRHWQRRLEAKVSLGPRSGGRGAGVGGASSSVFHTQPPPFKQRRTSSNATGITQVSPREPRLHARSCSVFSVSSFPHGGPGEHLDGFLSAQISGAASANSLVFVPRDRAPDNPRDLKAEALPKQYLTVPQIPPEPDTMVLPSQTFAEKQSSTYVFGNIIVKVENDAIDL
uniref:5-hydroxytryptamine receptor 1 n=1 Tax=Pristiophorus japonicus TaxID=55135 RepID=UPI00398F0D72